ncbi:hypothetical protein D3C78_1408160 [compost metagenome]
MHQGAELAEAGGDLLGQTGQRGGREAQPGHGDDVAGGLEEHVADGAGRIEGLVDGGALVLGGDLAVAGVALGVEAIGLGGLVHDVAGLEEDVGGVLGAHQAGGAGLGAAGGVVQVGHGAHQSGGGGDVLLELAEALAVDQLADQRARLAVHGRVARQALAEAADDGGLGSGVDRGHGAFIL